MAGWNIRLTECDACCPSAAAALNHYSIQVGIGRDLIGRFAEEWVVDLADITA
ncbi:DUF4291 family protein [Saccharopolyspora sp. NPDC050642]|uniref:DUF4291 family protein n=1 Tax=Saccharopolyspora sp. NPDC050642 TaxID=3157099 RepID=UPI0033C7F706